jgi:hypothetical protein
MTAAACAQFSLLAVSTLVQARAWHGRPGQAAPHHQSLSAMRAPSLRVSARSRPQGHRMMMSGSLATRTSLVTGLEGAAEPPSLCACALVSEGQHSGCMAWVSMGLQLQGDSQPEAVQGPAPKLLHLQPASGPLTCSQQHVCGPHLAGFRGWLAPAMCTSCGVQWPPGKMGSVHSHMTTCRGRAGGSMGWLRAAVCAALTEPLRMCYSGGADGVAQPALSSRPASLDAQPGPGSMLLAS